MTGECFAEGSQVDSQERLTGQLEAIARFHGDQPVEVVSLIHPKMSFLAAWPSLDKVGFPLQPDLVVINMVAPDQLTSLHVEFDAWRWGFHPDHPQSTFFERDRKTGQLRCIPYQPDWNLYLDQVPPRREAAYYKKFGGVDWQKDLFRVDPAGRPPFLQETIELLAAILKHCNEEARKHGGRIALLDSVYLEDRQWVENGVAYDTRCFHALLQEAATKAGIVLLDGNKVLREKTMARQPPRKGHLHQWEHNGHWTPAGHRFVAEGLWAELRAHGLLEKPRAP
jgi:hypothetical protein